MADIGTAYIRIAPNMTGIQGKIAGGLKGSGSTFASQFGGEISGKSAVIIGAISGIAQSAVTKAMSLVTNSISGAIKRVDTLNSAQKTFQFMGFAAADAKTATAALTKSIEGLPTPLDGAIRGMTSLAATYGNIKTGQKVFTALNNAILGFGGSAVEVDGAVQQLSQLPMDGPLDAQTWNSLRNSGLTPVLVAMSKDFGMSVGKLKEAFGTGKLTVKDFTDELVKMNTKGGGGLVSLEKISQNATSGIGTGFANMQTAITRGLAKIIQSVGQKNISQAIANIGTAFEKVLGVIATKIPPVLAAITKIFNFVARNKDIFVPLAVGILAVVAAMKVWKLATAVATGVQAAFNAVMAADPISIIILALVGLVAALTYFFTRTETGKKVFAAFAAFFKKTWDVITGVIKAVGNFFKSNFDTIKKVMIGFAAVILLPFLPIIALVALIIKNFTTIKNFIMATLTAIWAFIGPILNFIKNLFIIVFGSLAIIVLTALTIVKNIVMTVFNAIWSVIKTVTQWIWDRIVTAFNFYKNIIMTVFNAVSSFVSAIWNTIYGTISGIVKKLIAFFAPAFNWLLQKGKDIVNGLVSGIKSVGGAVWGAIKAVADKIGQFFSGAGKWLYNVGRDIVQGLINGIKSMVGAVTNAAGKIGGAVKDKVKGLLGIHSPSTVFAEIGVNIGRGMAKGIEASSGQVSKSVDTMTNAALQGVTSPTINPQTAFGTSANATPATTEQNNSTNTTHIDKVYLGDQSAVKEFFKQLNQDTINVGMGLTPVQGAQP